MRPFLQSGTPEVRPSRLQSFAAESREALIAALREGRQSHDGGPYRAAVTGGEEEKLRANREAVLRHLERSDRRLRAPSGAFYAHAAEAPGPIAFLFPGQGSQYPGMLAELCAAYPPVRDWFDGLDAAVADIAREPPTSLMFPPADLTDQERSRLEAALLTMEGGAQLGFIAGLALHELLTRQLGIRPGGMLGHSNGEHAALVASRTFVHAGRPEIYKAARDGMLAARRLPPPVEAESSVAVSACPRAFLAELIASMPNSLFLAMDNAPSQVVLAGRAVAVERAIEQISTRGGICVRLPFPYAYHTPLFDGWRRTLGEVYRDAEVAKGDVPVYSCATAEPFPADPDAARELAARQWTTVVRFADTIERMYADGYRTFVEVGPGNKLTGLVDDILRKRPHLATSACSNLRPELEQLDHLRADLFIAGYALPQGTAAVPAIAEEASPLRATLIAEHFALMNEFLASQDRVFASLTAALATPLPPPLEITRTFVADALLRDHSLGNALPVIPFTMSLQLAADAVRQLFGNGVVVASMKDVRGYRWLALDQGTLELRILATPVSARSAHVQLFEGQFLAFEADVEVAESFAAVQLAVGSGQPAGVWTAEKFYSDYAFHGPLFQGIREVHASEGNTISARCEVTIDATAWSIDPALLDCAGQLVGLWLLERGHRDFGIFPFRLRAFSQHGPTPPPGAAIHARATIQWDERGATDATIELLGEGGRLLYRLEGFEQRYMPFPPSFAPLILGKRHERPPLDAADLPPGFLEESWGIWGRALAHVCLDRDELRQWYSLPRGQAQHFLLARAASQDARRDAIV